MSGEHGSVGGGLLGRIPRRAVATIAAAAAVLASATSVVGSTAPPPLRVIQPGAAAALTGQTYSQWSVEWWQTMMAQPTTDNPGIDFTGANCALGNSAGIFFLAGDFTGSSTPVHRTCTVPANRPLLVPITNVECSNIEAYPFYGATPGDRAGCARSIMDDTVLSSLSLTIDGRAVPDLTRFRFASPPFVFTQPSSNNLTGAVGPTSAQSASDGYWVLLAPPSPGTHVLHFTSLVVDGSVIYFPQDITYTLTVH